MSASTIVQPSLAAALWPAGSHAALRNVILAVAGSLMLWVSAKVQVPMWPVPMTMQTFAVLVIGMAFGWKLGGATVLLYLAEGAFGLPVFAGTPEKGIGLAYMAGPTGGYLVGFVLSAIVVGRLASMGWDRSIPMTAVAMIVGTVLIFLPGLLWLSALIGVEKAIQFGLTPFLVGAVLKIALAAAVLPYAWKLVGKSKPAA